MEISRAGSQARFASRTRAPAHVVWITDAHGRFTQPQATWNAYTGQDGAEAAGHGWHQVVHPEDRDPLWRGWQQARDEGGLYVAQARLWHAPSGRWRRVELRAVPDMGEDRVVRGWVGTCIDIEERRHADTQLRIADRRKDEFMGVLAHELRNPLAPIRNAVHVLKVCRGDDTRAAWARGIIERQVDQMARLLDDLLDLTRIARGKLEVRREHFDLHEAVERAMETSRPLVEAHGHHFGAALSPRPQMVEGDPPRLAQVFANLLNNAAKYTDRGGEIALATRIDDGHAVVSIRDNGIGIDPAMLPQLFTLYAQADAARDRAQGGLGIGLALVRGLVEMHGGSVTAFSGGAGQGTTVTVRLPLVTDDEVLPPPRPQVAPGAAAGVRVLLADDNHDAAQTLAVVLQMQGHDVRVASDGLQAVQAAAEFRPQAVLLDIGMPRLDGYEAARRIRVLLPDALLIATTGWCRREDLRRAAEAGFDHHLVKPVDPEQMARLIGTAAR